MAYFPLTRSGLPTEHSGPRDRRTPKIACASILLAAITATALVARSKTGGSFVYPVDDAYIHLAAAKHFVESSAHDRTLFSASSSIAWPWLLTVARFFSLGDVAPLLFNGAAALALFASIERSFHSHGARHSSLLALGVCWLVPIVPLVLSGMEHTAHAFCAVAVAGLGARAYGSRERIGAPLAIAAAGAVAFRYEGAFVVGAVALLLFRAKRAREAAFLLVAGAAPAIVRGIASIARGGLFFPVPVTMKRTALSLELPATIYYRLIDNPHVLVAWVLLAFAWTLDRRATDTRSNERLALVFVAAVTLGAQTVLAQLGWFYRYEAYAMALALLAIATTFIAHGDRARAFALPLALLVLPIVGRATGAFRTTILASRNIFDQEMQMASFVRTYYDHDAVALNDIGAVSYFTDARVVDLIGLGSPRIAAARGMRIDGALSRDAIETETRDASTKIAIVYEDWFAGALPVEWRRVGSWAIPDNHVCAKDTVTFYATSDRDEAILRENLRAFSTRLPEGVTSR